jgi:hypothetical protein
LAGEVVSWVKHSTGTTGGSPERSDEEWLDKFKLECAEGYDEPEPEIAALLAAVEALDPPMRSTWVAGSLRVFDLGYDCGLEPFAFRQGLSAETLARLAAVRATLRFTLFSDPEASPPEPRRGLSSGDS